MGELPCFDKLKTLAAEDPVAFDRFRQDMCQDFINSIPPAHRPRMQAIQFRVDHAIRRAKTPLAGLILVSGMMHDSLRQLSWRLEDLKEFALDPTREAPPAPPLAEIVYLDQWRRRRRGPA